MSISSRRARRVAPSKLQFLAADQAIFPDRRLWGHIIPHGLPNYSEWATDHYGALYPLDLVEGNYQTPMRSTAGVPRALQAGITGMQIMQFGFNAGTDFVTEWMDQADTTWTDNSGINFMVSPCISAGETDTIRMIQEYVAGVAGRPSASMIDGKYVVWLYGARHNMDTAAWARVRTALAGIPLFLIADLGVDSSQYDHQIREDLIAPFFPYFEASYMFDDSLDLFWPATVNFVNSYHRPYAGGLMPGYDREVPADTGGFIDAEGTKLYRRLFEKHIGVGLRWQNAVTWNDMVEHTDVQATSDWNKTRADLTAFYAAKHTETPYPKPQAELYITTPQHLFVGDAINAEAMVINGSRVPVRVGVQLLDAAGQPYLAEQIAIVYPDHAGDATHTAAAPGGLAGSYVRARATMYDGQGAIIQQATSAPMIVYPLGAIPTPTLRRLYYSLPAYAALPGNPTLVLSDNPTLNAATTATVTAPDGVTVRFSEVLQNTRQAGQGFTQNPYNATVSMANKQILNGQIVSSTPAGFYVARVIDEQERVGYSDPQYFA